jgi:Malectin domain
MISVIIILTMAVKVIAFDQIFAINAGGAAHTDEDGIIYQERDSKHGFWDQLSQNTLHMGTVPESDKNIYRYYEYKDHSPINYHLPLENDGLYVLIAKFTCSFNAERLTSHITLNTTYDCYQM